MAVICQRLIPKISGLKDEEVTVGRHILFQCTGEWEKSFNFSQAQLLLDEKSKFSMQMHGAEARSSQQFDLDLVLYVAGEIKLEDLIITDGTQQISLGPQTFQVQSVLEKSAEGKQPEPFGAILPFPIPWPKSYWIFLFLVVFVFLSSLFWYVRKQIRYRQLQKKLKDYASPVDPDLQFYKSLRKAEMLGLRIADLEKSFRLYILRRYNLPAFDLKDSSLLRLFKKNHPWLKSQRQEIKKILVDLKMVKDTKEDKELLTKKMYRFVDHAEALNQKSPL